MKQKAAPVKKDSLRLFYVFCGAVFLLILGSLLIKAFHTVKNSTYDSNHAFVLSFQTKDGAVFYNIDPDKKEFSALRVHVSDTNFQPGRDLGIPVDSSVQLSEASFKDVRLKSVLPRLIFQKSALSWYDITRLILTTSRMNEDTLHDEVFQSFAENGNTVDVRFYDQEIVDEGASIAIINATSIGGVGGRLEKVVSNLGGSVISVTTAPKTRKNSVIQYSDPALYTREKLMKFLAFPAVEKTDLTTSDILIIVGEDGLASAKF